MQQASAADEPAAATPLIRFEGVELGYGRKRVLSGLSFTLYAGDYLGIVGPNGVGKTTLLKAVLGVLRPQAGRVTRAPGRGGGTLTFGYVPQLQTIDEIYPLTALDVVLMGRYRRVGLFRRPGKTDHARSLAALEQVGLADSATLLFRDLSGGQRQRVLMARALAADPDILVLDEPTNGMDPAAERATMDLIDRLHRESGLTVLVVSHLLNVVIAHVSHIAFLGASDFAVLPVAEATAPEHLSRLYGIPIAVGQVNGRRVATW